MTAIKIFILLIGIIIYILCILLSTLENRITKSFIIKQHIDTSKQYKFTLTNISLVDTTGSTVEHTLVDNETGNKYIIAPYNRIPKPGDIVELTVSPGLDNKYFITAIHYKIKKFYFYDIYMKLINYISILPWLIFSIRDINNYRTVSFENSIMVLFISVTLITTGSRVISIHTNKKLEIAFFMVIETMWFIVFMNKAFTT